MTRRLAGLACVLLLLVLAAACGDDDGGGDDGDAETVVADGDPVTAEEYAEQVDELCGPRMQAAEDEGYDNESADGAAALDAIAAELAAITPPEDRRDMAQAMVDGLSDYADLFRTRDEDQEEFSQNQNELLGVLAVRSAGLEADCGTNDIELSPPTEPEGAPSELADACFEGDLAACDRLGGSDEGPDGYTASCGGRLYVEEQNNNINCVESFASDRPVRDQP